MTDLQVSRDFRDRMRKSACARFSTVLGPGSDGYHENHVHVDLAQRSHGHRMCQWDIRQPAAVATSVPLPPVRPKPDGEAGDAGRRRCARPKPLRRVNDSGLKASAEPAPR